MSQGPQSIMLNNGGGENMSAMLKGFSAGPLPYQVQLKSTKNVKNFKATGSK